MAEQLIRNEQVVGSIPTISSRPVNGLIGLFTGVFLWVVIAFYKNCIVADYLNVAPFDADILRLSHHAEKAGLTADNQRRDAACGTVELHIAHCAELCSVTQRHNILVAKTVYRTLHRFPPFIGFLYSSVNYMIKAIKKSRGAGL